MPVKRTKPPERQPEPIQTYGFVIPDKPQHFYDMAAFARRYTIDRGVPRRVDLFKRITDVIVPGWFEWHEWTERVVGALCENQWTGIAGAAGSAKTRNVTGFACAWWLCNPLHSSVILCSTTMKSLRKRAWAEVQSFHTSIPGPRVGNFVDSRMLWQYTKGDDKHAVVGIAVEEGSTAKVADNIKGIHTKRQMIVLDEATSIPPAIFDACTNMYAYPEEFLLVMLGNPRSRLDEFGKFCEPVGGWNSVNVDTEEWETKPQLNGINGIVIRFDAEKSPNIKEGRLVSRHLPTREKVEARRKALVSENDPLYWSNDRGFWAPEGLTKTVFTESALLKHNAFGKHMFTEKGYQIIGACDPAFGGGDKACLRFAKLGEITPGRFGIEAIKKIYLALNANSSNPIHYQLSEQIARNCESFEANGIKYSCPPENLGMDATGEGGGTCDILQRTWSPRIMRIEFGGKPSDDPISLEDIRPASEVYHNKRVEMYFRARTCLNSGQLCGMDTDTAKELCSIEFLDDKAKMRLISKSDYRVKCGKSPDDSDSYVMLCEVARRKGFRLAPVGQTVNRYNEWRESVNAASAVYSDDGYHSEELEELEVA